jgi:hypothetical protein
MKVPANVPVDGFWSISVYSPRAISRKLAYSINNITAKKDADGGVTIQFGGCDGKISNCLPITEGGITQCECIARAPKFSAEDGNSRRRSQ